MANKLESRLLEGSVNVLDKLLNILLKLIF